MLSLRIRSWRNAGRQSERPRTQRPAHQSCPDPGFGGDDPHPVGAVTAVRVAVLPPASAAEAGDLLAASHGDYPSFTALFPDHRRRRRILQTFMKATARDAAEHGFALSAGKAGEMAGVALWMPPGTFPLSARRKLRMLPTMLRIGVAAPAAFPRFARVGARLERSVPAEPFWYLQALGVHPSAQRAGVGHQLMVEGLGRVNEAKVRCWLHTSDPANVAYYKRYGFEIAHSMGLSEENGPRYIAMIRPGPAGASL